MPTYAYRCRDCGHQFDIFQKFSEDSLTVCPSCEGSIRRVIQPTGIVFKGTGFYVNDSKNSAKNGTDKAKTAADASDSSANEPASGDKAEKSGKSEGTAEGTDKGSTEKAAAGKPIGPKSEPAAPAAPAAKDRAPAATRTAST